MVMIGRRHYERGRQFEVWGIDDMMEDQLMAEFDGYGCDAAIDLLESRGL